MEHNPRDRLMTQHLRKIRSKSWEARNKWLDIGLELNLPMDDLNALQLKHSSDAGKCFTAMLNLWLNSIKQPTLTALIAALRERTVNQYAVAEELEILRENLRQQSGAAEDSDVLISQDSTDFSLPPTVSEACDEKTRKHKQNSQDTRDDAEEKIERRENGQPTSTGGERKKQEKKYAHCMRTYIFLITVLVAILSVITISALTDNTCHVIAGGKGFKAAIKGERPYGILVNIDRNGQLCTDSTPIQIPTCWLQSNTSSKSTNCTITKLDKNILEISYQPTYLGKHQLHIKMEEEHIKGSPFSVSVIMKKPINIINGLKNPWGVAVNKKGEVIVAEKSGHCISIFSPMGQKIQSFGSEGTGPGQFNKPRGVAVDDDGNIIVADTRNHRIQKFTSDCKYIARVGSHGSNHSQFNLPTSLAISPITKKIAISDWDNDRIQILNPDLTFHSSIGSKGSSNGKFNGPNGLAFDSAGNLYVTDPNNHRIQVFNPDGQFLQLFGKRGKGDEEIYYPVGISIGSDDTVYVVDCQKDSISAFTREGKFLASFGSWGDGPGQFDGAFRIAVDKKGTIYVNDHYNNRVQIFAKVV